MNAGGYQLLSVGTGKGDCLQKKLRRNNQRSRRRTGRDLGQRIYEESFKCSKWRTRSLLPNASETSKKEVYPLDLSVLFGDLVIWTRALRETKGGRGSKTTESKS